MIDNVTDAHYGIMARIFRNFDPKREKIEEMKQWLHRKAYQKVGEANVFGQAGLEKTIPNENIMEICRYTQDIKYTQNLLLFTGKSKESTILDGIFSGESRFKGAGQKESAVRKHKELREFFIKEMPVQVEKLLNFNKLKVNSLISCT